MQVWCFVNATGLWALSGDAGGVNLPIDLGPWKFRKVTVLTGEADDERQAEALLTEHGYCCFEASDRD